MSKNNMFNTIEQKVKWDLRFLKLAKEVSTWSKDPSTQVGAVITRGKKFISLGYNGLPEKISDTDKILNDRELKYDLIIHAEINAILSADRDLTDCTLYTYPFLPCSRCAAQVIQKNITRVVSISNFPDRWAKNLELSGRLLEEAGVPRTLYSKSNV